MAGLSKYLLHFILRTMLTNNNSKANMSQPGWWLGHPSEKYESQLGWLFPTKMGQCQIHGNQSPPTSNQISKKNPTFLDFHMNGIGIILYISKIIGTIHSHRYLWCLRMTNVSLSERSVRATSSEGMKLLFAELVAPKMVISGSSWLCQNQSQSKHIYI